MVTKVKIGTLELSQANGYYLKSFRGIGYSTKYPKSTILYMHGADLGDTYFNNKQFALEFKVVGSSPTNLLSKRSSFFSQATVFDETAKIDLLIYLANGVTIKGTGVIKEIIGDISQANYVDTDISIIFEMEKPYFVSDTAYRFIVPVTVSGGAEVPMEVPLDISGDTGGGTIVGNGGNVFVYPEIYLHGQLTNPVLENLDTGESLSIASTVIASGSYYYIDTFLRTVTDNSGNNKRDKFSGDFMKLAIGDNTMRLRTDDVDDGYAEIIYNYGYISF